MQQQVPEEAVRRRGVWIASTAPELGSHRRHRRQCAQRRPLRIARADHHGEVSTKPRREDEQSGDVDIATGSANVGEELAVQHCASDSLDRRARQSSNRGVRWRVTRHCHAKAAGQDGRRGLWHQADEREHRGENAVTGGIVGRAAHNTGRTSLEQGVDGRVSPVYPLSRGTRSASAAPGSTGRRAYRRRPS